MPWSPRLLIGCGVALALACGPTDPTSTAHVRLGTWGGTGILLTVTDAAATVELDCAHGTIDQPLLIDQDGRFDVPGTFVREHGGPIQVGEAPDQHPARYSGTTDGRTMTLTITVTDQPTTIGSFSLTHGAAGRIVKCL